MIPVECVVRGYLYGSLYERLVRGEVNLPVKPINAGKLPSLTLIRPTKSDVKDEPVTVDQIVDEVGWTLRRLLRSKTGVSASTRKCPIARQGRLHSRRSKTGVRF